MCVRGEVKAEYPCSLELVLFLIQDFDVLGLELTPAAHCILHDKTDSDSTVRRNGPYYAIGHFRVPLGLCFKTRVGAQPLIWKSFFILMQIKLIFTRKVVHLASFWKWGFLELGSSPLSAGVRRRVRLARQCNRQDYHRALRRVLPRFCKVKGRLGTSRLIEPSTVIVVYFFNFW